MSLLKIEKTIFPYPVLSCLSDDYENSDFIGKIDYLDNLRTNTKIGFQIKFILRNDEIEQLIREGKAKFAAMVEGKSSVFRKLYVLESNQDSTNIIIDAQYIDKKCEICPLIIATERIDSFRSESFNNFYYDSTYTISNIDIGDILACDITREVSFEFTNSDKKDTKSAIKVSKHNQNYMDVEFSNEYIIIRLPNKAYEAYVNLSKADLTKQELMKSTVIQPALIYTIDELRRGSIPSEYNWVGVLNELFEKYNCDLENESSLLIAQKLLNNSFEESLYNFYEELEKM